MSRSVGDVPFYPLHVPLIRDWGHHVVGRLSCCLRHAHATNMRSKAFKRNPEWKGEPTWMVRTILLVSSRAAMAVDVPKEAVPLWKPRTIRPSFLYCSMGSQTKSRNPWTEQINHLWGRSSDMNKKFTTCEFAKSRGYAHPVGQESGSAPHLPTVPGADSSLCQSATHWLHRKTIYPHLIIWRMRRITKH